MATNWKKREDELNANYRANKREFDLAVNKAQSGTFTPERQAQFNQFDQNLANMNARVQDAQKRMANQQTANANLARRTQQTPAQTPQGANTNPMTSEDVMNQWMNRGPFQYDMNADAMYQHYKDQYMRQGRLAMQDTIGRASALTGGYGNSYATAAGQQQYNEYLAGLNDKALELSQMAYQRYQDEGDKLKDAYNMLYGRERDAVADEQWQKQFDEGVRQFDLTRADQREQFALQYDLDVKKFEEDCRRYGIESALEQAKFDHQVDMDNKSLEYDYYKANQDNAYRYSALAQDDAQFYANLDRQNAADQRDYELALAKLAAKGGDQKDAPALASVDYKKLGYKSLEDMFNGVTDSLTTDANGNKITSTPATFNQGLLNWLDKHAGYFTEDQSEAIWDALSLEDDPKKKGGKKTTIPTTTAFPSIWDHRWPLGKQGVADYKPRKE